MNEDDKTQNDTDGKSQGDNVDSGKDMESNDPTPTVLQEAKDINAKKEKLIEREEELMKRKEELHAEQILGGHANAGQTTTPPVERTNEEIANDLMEGKVENPFLSTEKLK